MDCTLAAFFLCFGFNFESGVGEKYKSGSARDCTVTSRVRVIDSTTMKACLCAIVCMHVMWAQGSRSLPPTLNRHVTFVIEGDWSAGMDLGSADYCSSGGLNHAKHLLSAFWSVSFALMPNRQPLMLRPRYIFAQGHGAIPENVKWQDLFDWEPYNVDSDEFKSPDDLWSAIKSNPGRFEVFDIFQNHGTLIDRVRRSEAEIAVIHM